MIGREVPKDAQGRDLEPGGIGFNRRGQPKSLAGPAAEFMPPHILGAFQPRPPLVSLPPPARASWLHRAGPSRLSGCAALAAELDTTPPPPCAPIPTREEVAQRKRDGKAVLNDAALSARLLAWAPRDNAAATRDAYRTLFIGRLAYETTERRLEREMATFGSVAQVVIVRNRATGESRGYGFVQFADEEDMKRAYKRADGLKLDGRRILVDVERGRTVRGWRPRRLGGGLGDTRRDKVAKRKTKQATWVNPPIGSWSMLTSIEAKAAAARAAAAAAGGGGVEVSRYDAAGGMRGGAAYAGALRDGPPPVPRARSRSRSRGRR